MRILVEQLNGETFELEVTAEMSMRAVKEQVKRMHKWEDELSRDTTVVEVILGDKKVTNEEMVEELGLCEDAKVSLVFRKNVVRCSNRRGLGRDLDPEALVIVEIPDSETEIKAWAFQCCEHVAKVTIPRSVTRIGDDAFAGCSALAAINIPDSVTQVGPCAFMRCSSLATIRLPNSMTRIGDGAFERCSSLTSVDIPHSVTEIGTGAFANCTSLVTINIPDSVRQIGDHAFRDCSSLTSIDIPDSVTDIVPSAFQNCNQLTLRAPARLLDPHVLDVHKVVAKECGCGRCDWTWFGKGWVCPVRFPGK